MPLGIELTGYGLFSSSVILGFGIPKAVCTYKGQAMISTTLDLLMGVVLAFILFWLGVIDAKRPELSPRFFQVDLAPAILKILRSLEAYLWFLSVLLLLQTTMLLWAMLEARAAWGMYLDEEAKPTGRSHFLLDGIWPGDVNTGLIASVLAFSTTMFIFCLQSVSVIWPRIFRGPRPDRFLYSIMFLAIYIYIKVKGESRGRYTFEIISHTVVWMGSVVALLPVCSRVTRSAYSIVLFIESALPPYFLLSEAILIRVIGFPDFPGSIYGVFLSSCVLVFYLYRVFVYVPLFGSPR